MPEAYFYADIISGRNFTASVDRTGMWLSNLPFLGLWLPESGVNGSLPPWVNMVQKHSFLLLSWLWFGIMRKLCFWTMLTQGGRLPLTPDSGSHRPRNGRLESHFWVCWDVVEATADYNSCCLCSSRVELSTEKCLPFIGTDYFFSLMARLLFPFQLAFQQAHNKIHGLPTATAQSHHPQTCIQLLHVVLTFHLSWLFLCIFFTVVKAT